MKDNRISFNFILKEHNTGVVYMGSQIDTCFYIVFIDEDWNYKFKTIPLKGQPKCAILANNDEVLMIGLDNQKLLYYKIDENAIEPYLARESRFT